MNTTTDKWKGIVGTIVLHGIVLLCLFFLYITPGFSTSNEELGGVPVMLGNISDAGGDAEPYGKEMADVAPASSEHLPRPSEEMQSSSPLKDEVKQLPHTQDNEQTMAVDARKVAEQTKKQQIAEEQAKRMRQEQEQARREAEERARKAEEIKQRTAGLFGNGKTDGSGRGETSGEGTQGVPTGNSSSGKSSGVGGTGTYDLGGRSVGKGGLVHPNYQVDDYGTVVVDIVVDPKGKVVSATIGRGTNTPSSELRNEALKAAKRTIFAPAETTVNQKGTITYRFNLK